MRMENIWNNTKPKKRRKILAMISDKSKALINLMSMLKWEELNDDVKENMIENEEVLWKSFGDKKFEYVDARDIDLSKELGITFIDPDDDEDDDDEEDNDDDDDEWWDDEEDWEYDD